MFQLVKLDLSVVHNKPDSHRHYKNSNNVNAVSLHNFKTADHPLTISTVQGVDRDRHSDRALYPCITTA